MTYPIVVVSVIGLIFVVMMTLIVPIFKKLFASLGGKLPLPTQILIKISNVLVSWEVAIVILVLIAGVIRLPPLDQHRKRPPDLGRLQDAAPDLRAARAQGGAGPVRFDPSSLLASGVPAMESLDITAQAVGNVVLAEAIQDIKTGVREGQSFAEPMRRHEVFPLLVVQMVEVGEQTGALDEMLQRVSDFYMGEVDQTVDNLTSILEPLLVVIMGIIVGSIIISLYLPMFDYIKLVK